MASSGSWKPSRAKSKAFCCSRCSRIDIFGGLGAATDGLETAIDSNSGSTAGSGTDAAGAQRSGANRLAISAAVGDNSAFGLRTATASVEDTSALAEGAFSVTRCEISRFAIEAAHRPNRVAPSPACSRSDIPTPAARPSTTIENMANSAASISRAAGAPVCFSRTARPPRHQSPQNPPRPSERGQDLGGRSPARAMDRSNTPSPASKTRPRITEPVVCKS